MPSKGILLFVLLALLIRVSAAQQKVIEYYDKKQTKVREVFYLAGDQSPKKEGDYFRFYPNGNLSARGFFANGKKDGIFSEYHPNGN